VVEAFNWLLICLEFGEEIENARLKHYFKVLVSRSKLGIKWKVLTIQPKPEYYGCKQGFRRLLQILDVLEVPIERGHLREQFLNVGVCLSFLLDYLLSRRLIWLRQLLFIINL